MFDRIEVDEILSWVEYKPQRRAMAMTRMRLKIRVTARQTKNMGDIKKEYVLDVISMWYAFKLQV